MYNYNTSLKSRSSDELVNTYVLRPIAGVIVRALYPTSITPNQVTLASIFAGLVAAGFYYAGSQASVVVAGILITLKDILDSADGQLARAKSQFSRKGRLLDSIGDVVVNVAVFSAIGWTLYWQTGDWMMIVLSFVGFVGITLRVSYHVFYHTSFLHLQGQYKINRLLEDVTEVDHQANLSTFRLQQIFVLIYGWQDRLMLLIDTWCKGGEIEETLRNEWYGDVAGLRLSGLLGFGTELFLLMICSVANQLELYLILNVAGMNMVLLTSILYRRVVLRRRLRITKRRADGEVGGTGEASRGSLQ